MWRGRATVTSKGCGFGAAWVGVSFSQLARNCQLERQAAALGMQTPAVPTAPSNRSCSGKQPPILLLVLALPHLLLLSQAISWGSGASKVLRLPHPPSSCAFRSLHHGHVSGRCVCDGPRRIPVGSRARRPDPVLVVLLGRGRHQQNPISAVLDEGQTTRQALFGQDQRSRRQPRPILQDN